MEAPDAFLHQPEQTVTDDLGQCGDNEKIGHLRQHGHRAPGGCADGSGPWKRTDGGRPGAGAGPEAGQRNGTNGELGQQRLAGWVEAQQLDVSKKGVLASGRGQVGQPFVGGLREFAHLRVLGFLDHGAVGHRAPVVHRHVVDGYMALLLPAYLLALGLGTLEVGVVATATLLGSALATLAVGAWGHRFPSRRLLRGDEAISVRMGDARAASAPGRVRRRRRSETGPPRRREGDAACVGAVVVDVQPRHRANPQQRVEPGRRGYGTS